MAIPSYSYVIDQINTYIVANGNNEITANVLNPILEIITDFANNHMGDLDNLTTDETGTLVDAINSLKQNINDIVGNSVQLHIGNANPNDVPPSTYNFGDFFMQLSPLDNEPIQLWQFNGFEWFAPDAATSWGDIEGNIADQTDLQEALDLKANVTDLEDYQLLSEKGEANGYTPLDSGAKVPIEFLPDSLVGQVTYQGAWNASTNTPNVGDATTKKGHYYVTSVAGTYLGISYEVGDWIISNGATWQKVDNTDAVVSVFGRIGAIVANSSDYSAFYVALSDYTASDVLAKLLTVDGSGSGLDADLLRGVHWGNVNTPIISSSSITLGGFNSVTGRGVVINSVGNSTPNGANSLHILTPTGGGFDIFATSAAANPTWELRSFSNEPISFSPGSVQSVLLNTSGNVSIGNTNDTYKLDVTGTGRFTGTAIAAPATLSTELVTKGQLDAAARPYKVYTALLSQAGTSAPTAIVLENTLGGTVSWIRSSVGEYVATTPLTHSSIKVAVFISNGQNIGTMGHVATGGSTVQIKNYNASGVQSDEFIRCSIEIRVYP